MRLGNSQGAGNPTFVQGLSTSGPQAGADVITLSAAEAPMSFDKKTQNCFPACCERLTLKSLSAASRFSARLVRASRAQLAF